MIEIAFPTKISIIPSNVDSWIWIYVCLLKKTDPRLDDKVYNGTKELIDASPLPSTVRVTEAFYSEEDDEDQVVGDIIQIERLELDQDRGMVCIAYVKHNNIAFVK